MIVKQSKTIGGAEMSVEVGKLALQAQGACVRVGLIGGQWKINPTYQDLELATFDVVVAGRMNDVGQIDILMVEGEAPEGTWERLQSGDGLAPTEEIVAEGLEVAKGAIGEIIAFQREIVAEVGVTLADFEPRPLWS